MKFYWKKKWENKICAITRTRLRPGKNKDGLSYTVFLNCKHGFYRRALIEWIKTCPKYVPTCPICRNMFDPLLVYS
jgi:hypothetical protein